MLVWTKLTISGLMPVLKTAGRTTLVAVRSTTAFPSALKGVQTWTTCLWIMVKKQYDQIIKLPFQLQSYITMELRTLTPKKQSKSRVNDAKVKEINNYLQCRIMPVFAPLQMELLAQRPADIRQFCVEWLKKYNDRNEDRKEVISDQEEDEAFQEKKKRKLKDRRRVRKGISGDCSQDCRKITMAIAEQNQNNETIFSQQTKVNLIMHLKKCIFFEHLSHESILQLIAKIRSRSVEKGEVVVREGDSGNILYIVQEGRFKCQKIGNPDMMKEYKAGQIFGELSLLYNHPRATTITAITSGKLFQLDRQEFNLVLRSKMIEKFRECEALIAKIDFFKDLDIYQKTKLFESLEEKRVGPEKFIIREGEIGNCFYLVAEGQLVAYKRKDGENKLVYAYKKGDYFGEIALLRNIPRQASIKTLTEVRLFFINRDSFVRIIGPLEGILSRSCDRYTIWAGELSGDGQS